MAEQILPNYYGIMSQAQERGFQRGQRSRLSELSEQAWNAPQGQQQSILARMAGISPEAAQGFEQRAQGQQDRSKQAALDIARAWKSSANAPPEQRQQFYQSFLLPKAQQAGLPLPQTYDPVMFDREADALIAMGGGASGPYADLPSDIRSLKLLQDNPELAALDKSRRQYSGMVPKLVETSQGYGWGTPGAGISLAPMQGVAGQGGAAHPNQEAVLQAANQAIQSGVPEQQVEAWIQQQLSQPVTTQGPTQPIAQPYQAPQRPSIPAGYRESADGLEYIPGGPADPNAVKPMTAQQRMKAEQTMRKERQMLGTMEASIDNTTRLIDDLLGSRGSFGGLTGVGAIGAKIPGSRWADLDAKLNTLRARSAFGSLQEMRANSPTGGALGQVSERELDLLMNAETQLKQSQSPEALAAALENYKRILLDSKRRMREGVSDFYREVENGAPADAPPSNAVPAGGGWGIQRVE